MSSSSSSSFYSPILLESWHRNITEGIQELPYVAALQEYEGSRVLFWFCFFVTLIISSLVEYFLHRLMHMGIAYVEVHREHHKLNQAQGVLWEFRDYVRGSLFSMCLPFLLSKTAGYGVFSGGLVYAAFAAYAHQMQHENPRKIFWMKTPVHYIHHKYGMVKYNFGIGVDWWDHVFGTYKHVEWLTVREQAKPEKGYLEIQWY